jgi:hypothetical protein
MANAPRSASRPAFAAVVQGILVVLMGLSFIMIAQQANRSIYQVGLLLMMVSTITQIAFGNIPPTAGFRRSMLMLVIILAIVVVIVVLGIYLVPALLQLGRAR